MSGINLTSTLSAMPAGGSRFAQAQLDFISGLPESETTRVLREIKAQVASNIGGARVSDSTMRAMMELTAGGK